MLHLRWKNITRDLRKAEASVHDIPVVCYVEDADMLTRYKWSVVSRDKDPRTDLYKCYTSSKSSTLKNAKICCEAAIDQLNR